MFNCKMSLVSSLVFLIASFNSSAKAMMMMTYPIPLDSVIVHLTQTKQAEGLEWANFAKEVLGMTTVTSLSEKPEGVTKEQIQNGIRAQVRLVSPWKPLNTLPAKTEFQSWKAKFVSVYGANSYESAWLLFQTGDKTGAKKILATGFDSEFKKVMKLKAAVYGMGQSPMSQVDELYKALGPLNNPKEQVELDKKMKQLKVRVSNLPESHIQT